MKNGKKWLSTVLILLMAALLTMPLGASAATVKLNKKKLSLMKGKTYTLVLKNTEEEVTWTSSKRSVAAVDANGVVTAKKKGTATITAKVGARKYKCKVTVKQPVTRVKLSHKRIAISIGRTYTLKAKVTPSNASSKALKWSTSDKSIVTVTSKGKIKAVSAGTATITAKAKDGSGKKAACKITVKEPAATATDGNESGAVMAISKPVLKLKAGQSETLTVSNAEGKTLVWVSSDTAVATVKNGKVTAKKAGKTVIVARAVGGQQSVSCYVTVTEASDSAAENTTAQTEESTRAKQLLKILQKYSDQVKTDKASGIKWGYSNSGAPSKWSTAYSKSRSNGITYCNCALLPRWALREMGVLGAGNFWGLIGGDIKYGGSSKTQAKTKAELLKYCEIIPVFKTPKQLLKEGNLLPGDICTYVDYQHTNVYAGDGLFYDSGRSGAIGGYQNGTFIFNSFGPAATVNMSGTTIGHIIRFK